MSARVILLGTSTASRNDFLEAVLRLDEPVNGYGHLRLIWVDSYDRVVVDEKQHIKLEGDSYPIKLALDKAITMLNFITAELTIDQVKITTPSVEFIVTPEACKLDDYNVVMYNHYKPEHQGALRAIGITAGQIQGKLLAQHEGAKIWWKYNYRFYCDQIAVPYYSAYHTPMYEPKHKLLLDAKQLYKADRSKKNAFIRQPSFHNEKATLDAMERIRNTVKAQEPFKPLIYTTDETGVADLVTAWDFDFSMEALSAMRKWLMEQYSSLDAINEQWETNFKTLEEVVPFTTDQMLDRGDNNLSPWADHRLFMNKSFADSVRRGTEEAHKADAEALWGIVGCQMPAAFGGYDYWLLSHAIDVIEPYNIGNNREIWRSFAPHKPAFTTSFGFSEFEVWRLWHQALHGDRGIIIYDEENCYLDDKGRPTKLASNIAPVYKELIGGIIKQFSHAEPADNSICIHYSQSSITAHWMLQVKSSDKDWVDRDSRAERLEADFMRLRESCTKLIEDSLLDYGFIAYEQLENEDFDGMNKKVLILPQSIAMSKGEVDGVYRFVERGGTVVADFRTALMDEHCKMLGKGQLDDLFGIQRADMETFPGHAGVEPIDQVPDTYAWAKDFILSGKLENVHTAEPSIKIIDGAMALYRDARGVAAVIIKNYGAGRTIYLNLDITDYHRWRLRSNEGEGVFNLWKAIFNSVGLSNPYQIKQVDGSLSHGIEFFEFNYDNMNILGIHRNYQNRVSELGPPEYQDQSTLEAEMDLVIDFGNERAVYDTLNGEFIGMKTKVAFSLDKWKPTLFTVLDAPIECLQISASTEAKRGQFMSAQLRLSVKNPGNVHVFRAMIIGPDGNELDMYTVNLLAPKGQVEWRIPFAVNDPAGEYTLCVRDIPTGIHAEHKIVLTSL